MADTVINQNNVPRVIVADSQSLRLASAIAGADTDHDHKVSARELVTAIRAGLPKDLQIALKNQCPNDANSVLKGYLSDMTNAASIAVQTMNVTEVVVPDVPHLCGLISEVAF